MMNKNLQEKIALHIMFILMTVITVSSNQCCLQFSGSSCLSCPTGMHLYRSNCIFDLEGCQKYINGFDCLGCRPFFSLNNGTCKHARFPPSLTNSTDFQVYLQSNLKPDHVLDIVLKKINNLDTWIDWLSHSLLLNKTHLNRNSLVRNAQKIMNSIISSQKLHYIFTGNQSRAESQMLYYRLTYELNLIGGFADCIVAVEMVNGSINYMELNEVKQKSLDRDGVWQEMKHGSENQSYALSKVEEIFGKKDSSQFLKGYLKQNAEDVNITMFFMDKTQGVIAYMYIADKSQLPTPKIELIQIDKISPPSQTSSQTLDLSKDPIIIAQNKSSNITIVNQNNKIETSDRQKQLSNEVESNSSKLQIEVDIKQLETNPIFITGYALYLNTYQTARKASVQTIFYVNKSKIIYGMYMKIENKEKMKFSFGIDENKGQIQIINYQLIKQQNTLITHQPSPSQSINANSTLIPNISTNPSSPIPTPEPLKQQLLSSNSSIPSFCSSSKSIQIIDITNKQSSDIFLPQINLVLKAMHNTLLTNSVISSVKYSIGTKQSFVSNISYYITYKTADSNYLDFQVAIINNQFQLIRSPNQTSPSPTATATAPQTSTVNTVINTTSSNNSESNSASINTTSLMDLNNQTISPTNTVTTSKQNAAENTNISNQKEQTIINQTNTGLPTNSIANQSKEANSTIPTTTTIAPDNTNSSINQSNQTQPQQKNNKTVSDSINKDSNISDKKNQTTKTQTNSSSPSTPENKTDQSQSSNSSNTTTPDIIVTIIPKKNYTTQPRYKSLIAILRSLYRIPANASIQSMNTWQIESGERNYQIIFKMIYQKPINDDVIAKVSSYNVSVNSNSFVSVLQQVIQYEKKPALPVPKGPSLSRSYSPLPQKPQLSLIGALPANLKRLYDILTSHSPSLKQYSLQSLKHEQGPQNFGGMVSSFVQKVKFSNDNDKSICFDIIYEQVYASKQPNSSHCINLITYTMVSCPVIATLQQSIPNSNPSVINFDVVDSIDPKIKQIIKKISKGSQIEIVTKETFNNFMRIRYRASTFGLRQILIDTTSMFILTYQSSPQLLYSQQNRKQSLMRVQIIEKLRCQIQSILNLPPKTIDITIIQKHSENTEAIMLNIICKNTIKSFWYSKVYEMIKVQAVYLVQKSLIKIINANSQDFFFGKHIVKSSALQNWGQITVKQSLEEPLFGILMASMKKEYSSFIENTTLLSAYIESSNIKTLQDYLSNEQGSLVVLTISKRYTATYYSTYLIKVRFYASKNISKILNLQALSLSSLAIDGCFVLQNENTNQIPVCARCKDGYRIFEGFCQPIIDGCIDYSMSKCVKCNSTMLISQDMQSCLALNSPEEQKIISKSIQSYI